MGGLIVGARDPEDRPVGRVVEPVTDVYASLRWVRAWLRDPAELDFDEWQFAHGCARLARRYGIPSDWSSWRLAAFATNH